MMKKIFSNAAFNFSCVAMLGIGLLYYYFSKNLLEQQTQTIATLNQYSDLSAKTKTSSLLLDSLKIYGRPLVSYQCAMNLLYKKLSECKTDVDSIDVCAAFVYRVFDFGGTHDPQFPGDKWIQLSFKKMYAYAQYDSGGIYCGPRTQTLEKLLQHIGFTDMIEYSVKDVHTFLLVRTKEDKAWIADGFGNWGIAVKEMRTDFVHYLKAAKENPTTVKCIQLPALFGLPEDLQGIETLPLLKSEANNYVIQKYFCNSCGSKTLYQWLPHYLFYSEDTSKFKFKLVTKRNFAEWADKKITNRNAATLWLAPDSVAKAECYYAEGSDTNWANKVARKISTIRNN